MPQAPEPKVEETKVVVEPKVVAKAPVEVKAPPVVKAPVEVKVTSMTQEELDLWKKKNGPDGAPCR